MEFLTYVCIVNNIDNLAQDVEHSFELNYQQVCKF